MSILKVARMGHPVLRQKARLLDKHEIPATFMVPGQVITQATIDFMRKLDVREIHGYERGRGLKLIRPDHAADRHRG